MQKSDSTKKSCLEFQQETFFYTQCYRSQSAYGVSIEPTVAGSSDDENEVVGVQDEEKTSTITPLDELSPRHTKRRTDALFSLLKEEAEGQIMT